MRILCLLLLACDGVPPSGGDLSAGDLAFDLASCPGANIEGACSAEGQVCDYGVQRCVCFEGFWACNDPACPNNPMQQGTCSPEGVVCGYGLSALYCVDAQWLSCGDAVGYQCMEQNTVGDRCCPNAFVSGFGGGCACYQGQAWSCDNYHVRSTPCD